MQRTNEQGNVLFFILIAVVLMGALTYTMTNTGGDQSSTNISANRLAEDLQNQAQMIRSALSECTLVNNYGYPDAATSLVKDLKCKTSDTDEQLIFAGSGSRVLPLPPAPFEDWKYLNDNAGTIEITIAAPLASAGRPAIKTALSHLKDVYRADEVDIINDGSAALFGIYITKP